MKKLAAVLVAVLVLAVAAPALAATLTSEQSQEVAELTPEQSQEIAKLHQQILELRKQLIDKYVEYGRLTQEQGQQLKDRIQARQKFLQENPDWFGRCPGFGPGLGRGHGPRGMMGGWQPNNAPPTGS